MASTLTNPLCHLFLLLLPFLCAGQTYRNITRGLSLTATNDNSSWESPSGEFAFGFRQINGTGGYLLAIWFNTIPEKTIIWSANGNNLAPRGSKIQLTTEGTFVLNDPNDQEIKTDFDVTGVAYAAMLDTGNFVLASQDSANLWESFDHPTDTMLPTQRLNQSSKLVARLAEWDYSSGRFQFVIQPDGNVVLYTTHFPEDTVNFAYWSTATLGSGYQVIFNQSGYIYVTARNGSIVHEIFSNSAPTGDFYQRAILEYDGVFRQYVYPKTAGSSTSRWRMAWSTVSSPIPINICLAIRQETGSGACGFNSYCRLGDDQRPDCLCPPGYSFLDPSNKRNGCKQDFVSQNCSEGSDDSALFDFKELSNTNWPLTDYEHFTQGTEDGCREACLGDCFCAVVIFSSGGDCWKKKIPLSNGMMDPSIGGKALVKTRKDNITPGPAIENSNKKDQSTLILVGSLLIGSSVFLLLVTLLVILRFNKKKPKMPQACSTTPGMNLKSFSYNDLEKATNGFNEELGRGSFGTVYKGIIAYENGNFLAVKKLNKMEAEAEKEFNTEVSSIGRTNHKNLVQLLGYCNEGEHRLLVYEYMKNGSLASFLFGNSGLNWHRRIQIAVGTARGLSYLHEECSTQMIHCDIKPENILLDDYFTARISDFGLAKLLRRDQSRTATAIRGTRGYVAPEWFKSIPVTVKVDIYSFGVLFLELIFCRRNFEAELKDENQKILVDWAYDCYREGKLNLLLENDEEALCDMKRLEKFVQIAIWCIQEDPSLRPTMKKVTQMMEGAVDVSIPPNPSSFMSSF